MSNEKAIIIAALITIGGALLTHGLTLCFSNHQSKKQREYEFFLEILPKRIILYEDITLFLLRIIQNGYDALSKNGALIDPTEILNKIHIELLSLEGRCALYGDEEATKSLTDLRNRFAHLIANAGTLSKLSGKDTEKALLDFISPTLKSLNTHIKKESFSVFVKRMADDFTKTSTKHNTDKTDANTGKDN